MSNTPCCEVPLIELLRSVPADYCVNYPIQWSKDGHETGHRHLPVGHLMHRAAEELTAKDERIREKEKEIISLRESIANMLNKKWSQIEIDIAEAEANRIWVKINGFNKAQEILDRCRWLEDEIKKYKSAPDFLAEALNSGDGTYKP